MAEIVGVFAVSHTPVMTNLPDAAAPADRDVVYADFHRIGEEIEALKPDVMLLISDDHLHNFFLDCLPAFCIGAADRYPSPVEGWLKLEKRDLPGDAALGAFLVSRVLESGFDPALSMELTLDHGVLTPLALAGVAGRCPVVPILVNCVQPPLPPMRRCIGLGEALRAAILDYPEPARIVVLATGGLSHDVGTPRMGELNEAFDREFLRLIGDGAPDALARYAAEHVNEAGNGAEEVRNWLVAHGVAACARFETYQYRPVAAWYTGIALGRWRLGEVA